MLQHCGKLLKELLAKIGHLLVVGPCHGLKFGPPVFAFVEFPPKVKIMRCCFLRLQSLS